MKKCFLSCLMAILFFTEGIAAGSEFNYRASFNNSLVPETAPEGAQAPLDFPVAKAKMGNGVVLGKEKFINIPLINTVPCEQGSIMVWVGGKKFAKFAEDELRIIELGSGKTKLLVWKPAGAEKLYFSYNLNGQSGTQWFPIYDWKEGDFHCVQISWSPGDSFLLVDGEKAVDVKTSEPAVNAVNALFVGKSSGEYIIDEIFWYNRPIKELEAVSLWKTIYLGHLSYQEPFAVVNATKKAPVIDGVITEDEWQDATVLSGFIQLGSGRLIQPPVQVYMTYDKEFFYFGMRSPITNEANMIKLPQDSQKIITDSQDQTEIFIVPYYTWSYDYFQTVFDPAGSVYDGLCLNPKAWNGRWTVASRVENGKWTLEAKIDCASFPQKVVPSAGESWKINFCRTGLDKSIPCTQWSNTGNAYHNMAGFGSIRLEENKLAVKTKEFVINDNKNLRVKGSLSNLSPEIMDKVFVNVALFSKVSQVPGVPEWSENISIEPIATGTSRDFTFNRDISQVKEGTIVLKIYGGGETYYSQMANFKLSK